MSEPLIKLVLFLTLYSFVTTQLAGRESLGSEATM